MNYSFTYSCKIFTSYPHTQTEFQVLGIFSKEQRRQNPFLCGTYILVGDIRNKIKFGDLR